MSKYAIEDTTLTAIADAIRAKNGGTDPIAVADMATAISKITGGGSGGGGSLEGVVYVTFLSDDGTQWLYRKAVLSGDNCMDPVKMGWREAPVKDPTNTVAYTHSGWSLAPGGAADSSALASVTEDRTVYAAFTESTRYYTVRFFDGETLLHTMQVEYGATAAYTPEKEGYYFNRWEPINENIVADTDCYAQWDEILTFANGTWSRISEVCEAGQAADYFAIGDEKTIHTETFGDIVLRIIGINFDNKADGSGKAGITVAATKPNNVAITTGMYAEDNRNLYVWHSTKYDDDDIIMKRWCNEDFKNALPSKLVSVIKTVYKTTLFRGSTTWSSGGSGSAGSHSAIDEKTIVFIPSIFELMTVDSDKADMELGVYPGFDAYAERCLKDSTGTYIDWWTRTGSSFKTAYYVPTYSFTLTEKIADYDTEKGYYPCFCI